MSYVFWFLIVLHVVLCLSIILLVLMQNDKAGGLSSAFGGMGSSNAFTSAGAATFVSKLTKWIAGGSLVVIIAINILISKGYLGAGSKSSVQEALENGGAAKVLRDLGAPAGGALPGFPGAPAPGSQGGN